MRNTTWEYREGYNNPLYGIIDPVYAIHRDLAKFIQAKLEQKLGEEEKQEQGQCKI